MRRRSLLKGMLGLPLSMAWNVGSWAGGLGVMALPLRRVRPGDPHWPSVAQWHQLQRRVGGRLMKLDDPWAACRQAPSGVDCSELFRQVRNPYFILDQPALTQTLGWLDAWTSRPSAYAVAARSAADVAAAVDFARRHRLRLVVKGAGHSYQGTSDAPDSLLVWTRHMDAIRLHDAFVPSGCADSVLPQPAVSLGAGQIWGHTYNAVTTHGGRYVQGGGCMTVGVAGLVSSGGFGSFSKRYGLAAANLLEAEVVTADGRVRVVNARRDPELFWALKGGGGGSFGVITRLTLRTHDLPQWFGVVNLTVEARSDDAYRRLLARFVDFYAGALFNPHWGESVHMHGPNTLRVSMVFQGLDKAAAEAAWKPFIEFVNATPADFRMQAAPQILAVPAHQIWNPELLRGFPGAVVADDRPNAPVDNIVWAGDADQSGQYINAYDSAWLPQGLLQPSRRPQLVDMLYDMTRDWGFSLHFNKGLAGASAEALDSARDTAMNPQVRDAFALLITGDNVPPAYPGIDGHQPDRAAGLDHAKALAASMRTLRKVLPDAGSYVSESDYFNRDWQRAFWGGHYARLLAAKRRYDPDGLFCVHHGVGSEQWSADGFARLG